MWTFPGRGRRPRYIHFPRRTQKQVIAEPASYCRARARHESFNKRIKQFKVLSECFRHAKGANFKKHKIVFETICVIVQYEMENGHPLFDV
jgi:hypothetical protein